MGTTATPTAYERLGISLPAIKSRVRRGRQMLRDVVDECCEVSFDRRGGVLGFARRESSQTVCPVTCA